MKAEVKKLPRGQAELTIELTTEQYQPFLQTAAEQISQVKKIAGFRPGKASYDIVKNHVGEAEIWQQALDPAIRKTLVQALAEQNLITVGSPEVDVLKLAPGNPVIYKAVVNILPAVKLGDYTKIKIKEKSAVVKEAAIKKVITDLQQSRAKEVVVFRTAKTGDKIEIDFEAFLDKVAVEPGTQKKFPLVIGEGTFIPGFEDQLVGLKKDEIKEFPLKFPDNYHQKNLAGQLVDFKVKVNEVYERQLPELNDEFAKSLGDFSGMSAVEEKIKANLELEESFKEKQRLEEEMMEKIVVASTFEDIPDLLINSETNKMIEELEHNLEHQGLKFDDYLTHLKKQRADLMLDFAPQAIKRVKSALVMRAVAEQEKFSATPLEVDQEIEKTLLNYGHSPEIKNQVQDPGYRDYLKNVIASRKVVDHLKSKMVEKLTS